MGYKILTKKLKNECRRVSYYYYVAGLTQNTIAKKMGMSRQRVNRILSASLENGIVKISIEGLDETYLQLEYEIEKKYGLKAVKIIGQDDYKAYLVEVGTVISYYLNSILKDGDIIGIGRSRTISKMVEAWDYDYAYPDGLRVIQLTGGENEDDYMLSVDRSVYRLADMLNANASVLHAPIMMESKEAVDALKNTTGYKEYKNYFENCNVAITGIGTISDIDKYLSVICEDEYNSEWTRNIFGELATHFFDIDGKEVHTPFEDRIIAIELEEYKKIPIRIGIAAGEEKLNSIKSVLNGGYINVFVTNAKTAQLLLK